MSRRNGALKEFNNTISGLMGVELASIVRSTDKRDLAGSLVDRMNYFATILIERELNEDEQKHFLRNAKREKPNTAAYLLYLCVSHGVETMEQTIDTLNGQFK